MQPMHAIEAHFSANGAISGGDQRLIWELVANITPAKDVLARHGLTVADLKNKMRDPLWLSAFREARTFWVSNANVRERIKQKAGMLLEDSLEDLFLIIKDPNMAASLKMEATKQLGQLSQTINPKPTAQDGVSSGFKLTINLGDASPKSVTIDGHALEHQVTAEELA